MRMKDNVAYPKDVEVQAAPVVFEENDKAEAAVQEDLKKADPPKEEAETAIEKHTHNKGSHKNTKVSGESKVADVSPKELDGRENV